MIEQSAPPASRTATGLLVLTCVAGVVIALLLLVREAREGEPLSVDGVEHQVRDGDILVEGVVTNDSDVDRCPDVRAAARDSESRDLAEVVAEPGDSASDGAGAGRIAPDESVPFRARITGLTREDLDEKLDDVSLYIYEPHRCTP